MRPQTSNEATDFVDSEGCARIDACAEPRDCGDASAFGLPGSWSQVLTESRASF